MLSNYFTKVYSDFSIELGKEALYLTEDMSAS